jgi:uncharacterized protein (TIGR00255 family)
MTIQSMTSYGYGEFSVGDQTLTCEIKTLNSRYVEVNVRLPRQLFALETEIINHVKSVLRRGKVDVFIDLNRQSGHRDLPELDEAALAHYLTQYEKAVTQIKARNKGLEIGPFFTAFTELLKLEGITGGEKNRLRGEEAGAQFRDALFESLNKALANVTQARKTEGAALDSALIELLDEMERNRQIVASKRDAIIGQLRTNIQKRIENAIANINKTNQSVTAPEDRLLTEIAMISDKADIDEELTRLATHINEFRRLLKDEEAAGRKLDFICQEMHREVNTMSNKLVQTEVSQFTIEMKQTIERIRQQVQNIE